MQSLWFPGRTTAVRENLLSKPDTIEPAPGPPADEVKFTYNPGGAGIGIFGYKLVSGGIQTRMAAGGWQELTDPRVMRVYRFAITRDPDTEIQVPCAKPCPVTNDATCWPKLRIRNLSVEIAASAAADSRIGRSIQTRVRLRNDFLRFSAPGLVCPA